MPPGMIFNWQISVLRRQSSTHVFENQPPILLGEMEVAQMNGKRRFAEDDDAMHFDIKSINV